MNMLLIRISGKAHKVFRLIKQLARLRGEQTLGEMANGK